MDEEILKKAVIEQFPRDQAGIVKAEGVHFNEILKLRLEYRSEEIKRKISV